MAKNIIFDSSKTLYVPVASGVKSGDPVVYGQKPGVALTDRDADGKATVRFEGVAELSVKGIDGSGNKAIVEGDVLYFVGADTPKLSVKATGVRYGYAMGAVDSGATATIRVILGH